MECDVIINLDLFNNLLNRAKDSNFVQNFIEELSNYLSNNNLSNSTNSLKQENCLYQVTEMSNNGAYLQNTKNGKICKEKDIPQNILNEIGNDTVLRYKNGEYVIENDITEKFLNSLIDINRFEKIKNDFIRESDILNIDSNAKFNINEKQDSYTLLNYNKGSIRVPNELIPFFADEDSTLLYKGGRFHIT
ncbi:MAG: hypothetical protein Q4G05_05765 [Clostridia bacterium]|nr:hypothetical protein [Clostridia bacterium]